MENDKQKEIIPEIKPSVPIPKKVGVVETYAADMVKVMEKNEGGIIKKVIHEEEEREAIKKNVSPESSKNKLFMFIGVILIIISIVSLFVLISLRNKISTVEVSPQYTPLIFTDKTSIKEIAGLNKDQIFQTILNEVSATDVKSGGVLGIYFSENKKTIGLRKFLSLVKSNLTNEQITVLSDNFLLGSVNKESASIESTASEGILASEAILENNIPARNVFILLKTPSFIDVFPTMKNWENKMFSDLHGLFGIVLNSDTSYLLTKDFEDGIVGNKNAHILRDKDGNVVFEYVFADDTSVIIASKDEVAQEIMLRLTAGQIKK